MDRARIFEGLNAEQRAAVEAVRGPVCILAGAGTGKTTTITRRIGNQVVSGEVPPARIMAVTFTDKAAKEMHARLERLGVPGVRARTFHSAALSQLRHLAAEPPGQILASKGQALRQIANTLPKPYRFRPAADLAAEIEWAKNRRLTPGTYLDSLDGHEPPIPADLMSGVFRRYEHGKSDRGLVDFEDVLELTVRMYEEDAAALEMFQARYSAFTVDEYQDVNLLQESLLQLWLGERDDLCVVGDDYQSIYAFTGASATYLLEMPRRFERVRIVRLEQSYRSTPEVLGVANRLTQQAIGAPRKLRALRPSGPRPVLRSFSGAEEEARFIAEQARSLHNDEHIDYDDMAVLYRVNFRSQDFEHALVSAGLPFQVRDGAFLGRQAARRILSPLKSSRATDVAARVHKAAQREGWLEVIPEGLGEQEVTRQNDLARLIRLAEELDDGKRTGAELVAALEARFGSDGGGGGINLLSYHRAKGLEFGAVFLPRMQEGELPFRRCQSPDLLAEERRLFYVGVTRARTHLFITWLAGGRHKPSRFLSGLWQEPASSPSPRGGRPAGERDGPAVAALKAWRLERARADEVPAYVVLHDRTLTEIATLRPRTLDELAVVSGIGPAKLDRYGGEIIATLNQTPHS